MLKQRPRRPSAPAQDQCELTAREIGRALRQAREARGEELDEVADYLRIRPAYLASLEQGELRALPGRPYVVGFLRAYAAYLGMDSDVLVASLKEPLDRLAGRPALSYREPIAEARRGTALMVTASLVLAASVYAGYYAIYRVDRGTAEPVAEAPGEVAKLASDTLRRGADAAKAETAGPVGPTAPQRAARSANPPIPALTTPEERNADAGSAIAAELPDNRPPRATASAPSPARQQLALLDSEQVAAPHPAASGDGSARLALVATGSSWIQVRSTGKDYVRTRTLEPGERFPLPNRNDLALSTGDAGTLELVVDGESRGPLGQAGQVMKNLPLLPDQLRARAAR
jgi:cytoskeleton protein RodZ